MKRPDRQRLLLIGAGAVVALYILDSAVFTPLIATWKAHSAEIVKLQASVRDGRSLIERGPQLERTWSEMQANALPKDAAQAQQDVISAITRWGLANNVELPSIRPQWKRGANDRYSLLECRVDATGSLATLARFMYEVEHSPLALKVDSVELTARDEGGSRLALGLIVSGLRLSPLERKQP